MPGVELAVALQQLLEDADAADSVWAPIAEESNDEHGDVQP